MLRVNKDKCPQDHKCPAINICPFKAITQLEFNLPEINIDLCKQCMKCIKFCPKKAIEVVK